MILKKTALIAKLLHLGCSLAENVPLGETCNQNLTRIDPTSQKLMSDCDDKFFCNANNTCQWRGCRRFDQDLTYATGEPVPPFCPKGYYCPDLQNECRPLVPLGSPCELDRDGTPLLERSEDHATYVRASPRMFGCISVYRRVRSWSYY